VARELSALGHDVKQIPPAYAKPFRQGHKNDFRDAYAVAEAVQRPSTRCVPVKTDNQLDLQALHRVRSRLFSVRADGYAFIKFPDMRAMRRCEPYRFHIIIPFGHSKVLPASLSLTISPTAVDACPLQLE